MNTSLRQTLGLESAEVFSPSTIILEKSEVSSELELVNEVQEIEQVSTTILKSAADMDLVEESVSTLESILLTLEVSMEQHSVNNITHVLTFVSLENIEKRFGLESGFLTVGLEETSNENVEESTAGMADKIKGMLSQLKGAGSALLDKIAQSIEIVRKDIAKIAVRVKQRIQTLRSSINKQNEGGVSLKANGLQNLSGVSSNGTVTGSSFISALTKTSKMVKQITDTSVKDDALAKYIEQLSTGNEKTAVPNSKVLARFSKNLTGIATSQLSDKATGKGREGFESDTLITGQKIVATNINEKTIRTVLSYLTDAYKDIDPNELKTISTESEGSEPKENVVDKLINAGRKFTAAISKSNITNNETFQILMFGAWFMLGSSMLVILADTLFPFMITIGIPNAIILIATLLAMVIVGAITIKAAIEVEVLINRRIREDSNYKPSNETYTPSLEGMTFTGDLIEAFKLITTEYKLVDVSTDGKSEVKSMNAKEIDTVCNQLLSIADDVISLVSKTKDRNKLLKDYSKIANKVEKADTDMKNILGGNQATKFVKNMIIFEVDYCRSMSKVLLTGITYAEASNGVTTE